VRRHEPGVIWGLRIRDDVPNGYVRTLDDDHLLLFFEGAGICIDRRSARLLAKRINQCLDQTTGSRVSLASRGAS
jgi:hypothetical protein